MPLCGDPIYLTSVPFGQKRPSLPLGREIAKVSVWRANDLAVLRDIVFPIGRTTDLDNVRTLVSHFEHPPLDLADRRLPAIRQQVVNAPLPYLDGCRRRSRSLPPRSIRQNSAGGCLARG